MKNYNQFVKQIYCLVIFFCLNGTVIISSSIAQIVTTPTKIDQFTANSSMLEKNNDEYNDFTFAIIWGTFEILKRKDFAGLEVYNPDPNNTTLSVIGYVDYEHKFIFKKSNWISCDWWLGFVGRDRLFVIGWGIVHAW